MTIEATLASIDGSLISIATSLELIAGAAPAPTKAAAKPKATKAVKKAAPKEEQKEEPKEEPKPTTKKADAPKGPKLADVRTALGALQKATSSNDARALLAAVGGEPTLSKLPLDMYQAVIDAAAVATSEAS